MKSDKVMKNGTVEGYGPLADISTSRETELIETLETKRYDNSNMAATVKN